MTTPDKPSVHPLISKRQDLLNNVDGAKKQLNQHELKIKEAVYQAVHVVLGKLVGSQGYIDSLVNYGNTIDFSLMDTGYSDASVEMTWWKRPDDITEQYMSFIQALESAVKNKVQALRTCPDISIKVSNGTHNIHVLVGGKVVDLLGLLDESSAK